ncbi:MAG: response regulator transcription factor [Hydrogenoanaerobacterium sp.]
MNETIFITDDEENIRELLRFSAESFGYVAECFECAEDLLERMKTTVPSLLLLDIMLPGMSGLEALEKIKKNPLTKDLPVLMLTAKSGEIDKVRGLDCGAEDYITKPFGVLELSARIRAALRRTKSTQGEELKRLCAGDVSLDSLKHEVFVRDKAVELTLKEFDLLRLLMKNSGVVTREELLCGVWGYDYVGETRTLDMHIKTLRAKLGDSAEDARFIKTVRGVGYKFIG